MVTTPDKQSADNDLARRSRNAFNLAVLITVASGLVVFGTFLEQLYFGVDFYIWITAVGLVGGVIAMFLARRQKAMAACMVLVTSLFSVAALYVVLLEDVASILIVILIILSLGIVVQTVPANKMTRAIVIVVAIGTGLIFLDQFWPFTRNVPPPQTQLVITIAGAVTIVGLAIFVFRQFPTFSLRGKLIGATLSVAIIAVAAVAIGVNIFTTQTITTQIGANLNTITTAQSLAIGELLSNKVSTLGALSTNQTIIESAQAKNASYANSEDPPSKQISAASALWPRTTINDENVKEVLESDVAAELQRYRTLFPENAQLLVTDKYGAQIGATLRTRDYFKGDEAWWQETYASGFGAVFIGEPFYDSSIDRYTITIAIPIHAKTETGAGEIAGVIQAIVTLESLANSLQDSQFGETGVIEIFLEGNEKLTVDDQGEIKVEDTEFDAEALDYIANPDAPFMITEVEGTSRFLSSILLNTFKQERAIDQLNWSILATQNADEILAPVRDQQRVNTILGLIVVVSAGVVAAYVGQLIAQPITNLTNVAQEVAGGNLDIQAEIETQDEIGVLAASFNDMTKQLRESIYTLEQRVSDRTQALNTSIEVGRQLSTILDEQELITAVVNQIRDAFDYYQAQIYLLASDNQTLIMASGTGQAGQQMLTNKHQLRVGTGLVGRAAVSNQIFLVPDVTQDPNWLPNSLLPDTLSEAAVPIAIGDQVLGVLDIQHNIVNGLKPEDSELLQSIANQVAVALRNARLYKEVQQRGQKEAALRTINQKIVSTTDMETAMKVAIRELGQAIGTRKTIVRLGHHESEISASPSNGTNSPENTQTAEQSPAPEHES